MSDIEEPGEGSDETPEGTVGPGRPSKYKPEFCELVANMCIRGATDFEIAQALEIATGTFYRWQHEHPEFREALKLGKESADERVERSLYHRAVGYSFRAIKIFQNGEMVPYTEHVPPDVGAATMWLTNRKGDEWRSKQALEHTGKDGKPLVPPGQTVAAAVAAAAAIASAKDPIEAARQYQDLMAGD